MEQLLGIPLKDPSLIDAFYPMIFANIINTMESYLMDAYLNVIEKNESIIESSLENIPELGKKSIKQAKLFKKIRTIKNDVKDYIINNLVFHNINRIRVLYGKVLDISFTTDLTFIMNAVLLRHDIVHRNGKDKTGKKTVITKHMIEDLIKQVRDFINEIQSQLVEKHYL